MPDRTTTPDPELTDGMGACLVDRAADCTTSGRTPQANAAASPSVIHPFNQGYRDRMCDASEYDNPYTNEQWERAAWQHGWDHADFDLTDRWGPSTMAEMNP